ncbi:MAG: hypothetical protein WKG32_04720 [Gemmatimonadaceae bacterium]
MSDRIVERSLTRAMEWAESFAAQHWPSFWGAAVAAVPAAYAGYWVVSTIAPLQGTAAVWAAPLLGALGTFAAAGATAWRRRIPAGHVGVFVALAPETEAQQQQLSHDFLLSLRRLLSQRGGTTRFKLVTMPRVTAKRLCEDPDGALAFLERRGGHILVFGSVHAVSGAGPGARPDQLLRLEGGITHAPIPTAIHGELATDFREILPRRLRIRGDEAFLQFEAASDWLDVAVRHVVGFTAALSRDYAHAEALLLEVEARLPAVAARCPRDPALRRVVKRFPSRLALLYRWWLNDAAGEYLRTRDQALAEELDGVADRLLARAPDDYSAHLSKAMCEFVLRGDVAAARRYVFACRRAPDSTWRYSAAFLDAYQGKLGKARAEYMRAFDGIRRPARTAAAAGGADMLPVQCEEFIHLVLAREPEKAQLHFCTGLINKFAKLDPAAAARDFAAFLEATGPAEFVNERKLAAEWLREIGAATEHAA